MKSLVRTRIAPSPTGEDLHIGNVYTALINYIWAKKHNGHFIVRIEDTDQKRLVKGSEEKILESLKWFGLNPDEKVVHQSERLDIYREYAEELVQKGHAYYCDCTTERLDEIRKEMQKKGIPPKYDRFCLSRQQTIDKKRAVIRMKVPDEGATKFRDIIRGEISIENKILDDQVILKSDGFPTYHLAVVVDDHLMNISHVIRAEEWISSTPKHILLYEFFEWELPQFAHSPILRNPDKSKLSKRKNPVWVRWYREQGFLPEAILNYMATLGWAHPDEKDIFDLDEFIRLFDLKDIQKTGPVFDITKLEWMSGEYIRKTTDSKLKMLVVDYMENVVPITNRRLQKIDSNILEKTIPLVKTRMKKLSDYLPMCEFFFKVPTGYEREINREWTKRVLNVLTIIQPFSHSTMYTELSKVSDELSVSKSKLFMDIRVAITGKKIGPPLFESMEILGKEESVKRLESIIDL